MELLANTDNPLREESFILVLSGKFVLGLRLFFFGSFQQAPIQKFQRLVYVSYLVLALHEMFS